MRVIKVFLENGNSWITRINGTDEEIKGYFINQPFEQLDGSTSKCVKVEFLK